MSGPYPPPGAPRPPEPGGWWGGQQGPSQSGPHSSGPYSSGHNSSGPHTSGPHTSGPHAGAPYPTGPYNGPPQFGPQQTGQFDVGHDFPTVQYSGLGGQVNNWSGPPRRKRVGRIVVAIVSVLVIVGGVATGIVLLTNRNSPAQQTASTGQNVAPPMTTTPQAATTTTTDADPGVPNGSTTLMLAAGSCVSAQVTGNDQYTAGHQVACGSAQSDLMLAMTSPDMAGCADHQYLRLSAPNAGVDCFTLDVKQGDCVDNSYLKASCTTAPFVVLRTEAGPGSANSCSDASGATHWVPVGRDPVKVGCLAPTKNP